MVSCVLDTSMTLSFVLADEYGPASQRVLTAIADGGAVVPALWDFEVLNGLRTAERRQRITEAGIVHALQGLSRLRIERDHRTTAGSEVLALARRFDLSAYDASYLWLAIDKNLPLATLDSALITAATAAGVSHA